MGFMLSALGNLPIDENIELYVFVINGSWRGGPYELIEQNFSNIAKNIGPKAVIAKGFDSESWSTQVARKYFGKNHSELFNAIPALLITDAHPEKLNDKSLRLIVPLRDVEKRFGDWDTFFRLLSQFAIYKDVEFLKKFEDTSSLLKEGNKYLELKPNIFGIGINLNAIIERLSSRT